MVDAVQLIHQDHVNLDKVLTVLLEVGGGLPEHRSEDAISVLNDCVYYIQVFPERVHHPKEEAVLFPFVRRKRPDLAPVLDELEAQHEQGRKAIDGIAEGLRKLESDWTGNREAFQNQVRSYVESQREHMSIEEREILKPVQASLTSVDMSTINNAYGVATDPLFGENLATGFQSLLKRITR